MDVCAQVPVPVNVCVHMCLCVHACPFRWYIKAPYRMRHWSRSPGPRESLLVKSHRRGLHLRVNNLEVKKSCNSHLSNNIRGNGLSNEVK